MTQHIVGLTHKTRSQALTIEAEDALIASLKAKHANPDAIRMFANPIGAEIIDIPIKACRLRNEPPRKSPLSDALLVGADQDLMITRFSIATTGPKVAKGFCRF
jgi:hypothetical protein